MCIRGREKVVEIILNCNVKQEKIINQEVGRNSS